VAWVTTDQLQQDVADALKQAGAEDLGINWPDVCTRAVASARADILGLLLVRGYTLAQVELWPDLEAVHADQCLFRALNRGSVLEAFDEKFINSHDRREDLKTLRVTDAGGVAAVPAGLVGHGRMKNTPNEPVFTDPNSPRGPGSFRPW
jgi:hypothetical protein